GLPYLIARRLLPQPKVFKSLIMKYLIGVCIIVLWAFACPNMSRVLHESSVVKAHQQWMVKYGITYANSSEAEKRFNIFKENFEFIENFNNEGNHSYWLGYNDYSDLTDEELSKYGY
ncbi:hypothetical protein RYX36_001171, partial [Vicia faba]